MPMQASSEKVFGHTQDLNRVPSMNTTAYQTASNYESNNLR